MKGTLINVGTVVAGTLVGMSTKTRMPDRLSRVVVQGVGLFTVFIGLDMALKTHNVLIVLFSVVLGGVVGTAIDIERWLERVASRLEARLSAGESEIARGFLAASLLFCVGPMSILGSIEDGISGDYRILMTKAIMDGVCSIAFSASMGVGVALSALTILFYQGGLTLAAVTVKGLLNDAAIREMTATGGLLIVGIGLSTLEIKRIEVANLLPALVVSLILARAFPGP